MSSANESPGFPQLPKLYDVIIVGAGPCGLSVAARLCEKTPSALFTDEEHQRYHWINKHGRSRMNLVQQNGTQSHNATCTQTSDIMANVLVLDAAATEWCARWNESFDRLKIKHLRSPMFFQLDPADRDSLLAYAYETGRLSELLEIKNCVGLEHTKHKKKQRSKQQKLQQHFKVEVDERDRKDYYNPSQNLFSAHCNCVAERYGLNQDLIKKEIVLDIEFGLTMSSQDSRTFTVTTNKDIYLSKFVVLAVGAGNEPRLPPEILCNAAEEAACHSMRIGAFPNPVLAQKMAAGKQTNVLVIGGGLSSAQISDLAINGGVSRVFHLMRGRLKVKPFDVDLSWIAKFKNHQKAVFWSAESDEERLQQILEARNGGSITPQYYRILQKHIKSRRLSVHSSTKVTAAHYDKTSNMWSITTNPAIPDLPKMDYIYACTGIASNIQQLPYLQKLLKIFPVKCYGGFPSLTDDMALHANCPLFVTGKLGALRLGPGAGNLEGARVGAERIVLGIQNMLGGPHSDAALQRDNFTNYNLGFGNKYASLNMVS